MRADELMPQDELPNQAPQSPPAGGGPEVQQPDPADQPSPPGAPAPSAEKMVTIPTSSMSKIKSKAEAKGRKAAQLEIDARLLEVAKSHGYRSWEEMEAAKVKANKPKPKKHNGQARPARGRTEAQPAAKPPQEKQPVINSDDDKVPGPRILKRMQAENQRLLEATRRANRAKAHESRKVKEMQKQLDAKEAENALRIAASRAGCQDVDYALHLLRKDMQGKTAEELATFDESKYFSETLRQKVPYIFQTEVTPAETSPDASNAAPAPAGGKPPAPSPDTDTDAKKMSQQDYQALLRKRGLIDPSIGMPS